jgi:CAAX protease family protein
MIVPAETRLPATSDRSPRFRVLSALELLLGASIVIGHNVFRVLPNEVPILFVLGLVSTRLRKEGWSALGFKRPSSWIRLALIALAAATLRVFLGDFVLEPLTRLIWPPIIAPAEAETITGNIKLALLGLLIVWTFAAFAEEIAYRGYLLAHAADIGGQTTVAYWVGIVFTSVLFGYGHYYKGPAGILDSGVAGFVLGAAYMLAGRNLWVSILAHGFIDTFAVVALFFGWAS